MAINPDLPFSIAGIESNAQQAFSDLYTAGDTFNKSISNRVTVVEQKLLALDNIDQWDASTGAFPTTHSGNPLADKDTFLITVTGEVNGQTYKAGNYIQYRAATTDFKYIEVVSQGIPLKDRITTLQLPLTNGLSHRIVNTTPDGDIILPACNSVEQDGFTVTVEDLYNIGNRIVKSSVDNEKIKVQENMLDSDTVLKGGKRTYTYTNDGGTETPYWVGAGF